MNIETSQLVLRTIDLQNANNSNGQRGTINATNYNMTWKNVNLRNLLGPMYDRYDLFNLVLKSVAMGNIGGAKVGANLDSNNVLLNISGLPFMNQTYDIYTGVKPSAIAGTFQVASSTFTNKDYFDNVVLTFGKNQNMCEITINYTKANDNGTPDTSFLAYGDAVFTFSITGILKKEGDQNGSRLF